jgi:uncharacterized RDD family membrane protein YckC
MNQFLNAVDMSIASKGKRFVNLLIDNFLYYVISQIMATAFALSFVYLLQDWVVNNQDSLWIVYVVYMIINYFFYVILMTFQEYIFKGRTIGKYITGTLVVTENGDEPTLKDYFVRSLCRIIPFEAFSFLFGELGWHDSISKTRVVNNSEFMANKVKFNEINQIGEVVDYQTLN